MSSLDAIIHPLNRLQICAILILSAEVEFRLIREQLDVSDSVLSKQLKALEDAGYITLTKRREFGRLSTWIALTKTGSHAYSGHVTALKNIVGQ